MREVKDSIVGRQKTKIRVFKFPMNRRSLMWLPVEPAAAAAIVGAAGFGAVTLAIASGGAERAKQIIEALLDTPVGKPLELVDKEIIVSEKPYEEIAVGVAWHIDSDRYGNLLNKGKVPFRLKPTFAHRPPLKQLVPNNIRSQEAVLFFGGGYPGTWGDINIFYKGHRYPGGLWAAPYDSARKTFVQPDSTEPTDAPVFASGSFFRVTTP